MPGVSMVCAGAPPSASVAEARNASRSGPSSASTNPGLVQNWPAPRVKEPTKPLPIAAARAAIAFGSRKTGLMLLISA